jgi:prolyl-tRNA synthetase
MRQSKLFTKTRREAPADEVAKNAQLLIRAGFVHKEMAGVYDFLPLGLATLNRIIAIIREEMNAVGGEEVFLSSLQDSSVWEKTGRWSDEAVDVWFKPELKNGTKVGLATTHEEPLTALMTEQIASYKDLPRYVYQFQNKFRNETRAKSGIMRSREFIMKDLYSFSRDEAQFREFYEAVAQAYMRIFERAGIGASTYRTFASGGSFSKFSDEFQTVCPAGEDIIYIDEKSRRAINREVYDDPEVYETTGIDKSALVEAKSIEVGNIFPLGTKYSSALGLTYKNEAGEDVPVVMGSYGIGPARLMGTIVELLADEKGIVWPESVAPYLAHLICAAPNDPQAVAYADALYMDLVKAGVDVLYDDRDLRAGEKFADADLIGIPARIVVGKRTLESGNIESTYRATGQTAEVTREQLLEFAVEAQKQHRSHG